MGFKFLIKDPERKVRSLVKKLTHSGETDLNKEHLYELKEICKSSKDELMIDVFRECIKCLHKQHSQVRVSTVKLMDYLFQKSHLFRQKLLDNFDTFLELTLAISQKPKVKLKLPPPKKYAILLQELTSKLINKWNSDFGCGYERIRYVYKYLREHQLVDFSRFRVQTNEDLIKQQKLAEAQEKILTRSIENRLKEFREIKPEVEKLVAQIESLIDILMSSNENLFQNEEYLPQSSSSVDNEETSNQNKQQQHGIANITQNIQIEFSPYLEIQRNQDNKDLVQNLKELKKQLIGSKMTKLIGIEKTLSKRSDKFLNTLKEVIDLKSKAMNVVFKLSELKIVNDLDGEASKTAKTLDKIDSDSDEEESDFEEVEPKEDLETYIPKSMRFEYGLEPIDPKELHESSKITLTEENFNSACSSSSTSINNSTLIIACNVRLETGKLCPRRDTVKCPFHGKIIPRDHNGIPLNEQDRLEEEKRSKIKSNVPDWQDPQLLREIKAATGVDLTMPTKKVRSKTSSSKLINTKTCDLTPKQRLQRRLKKLIK